MLPNQKQCFVISPIGSLDSDIRKYSDKVLKFVIKHSLEPLGYFVVRADEISEPGTISLQIIKRIIESELVIADLTGTNPNVMYELAIRHAISKPAILISRIGENLPFDIASERTILFDINDIENVEKTRTEIVRQVNFIETNEYKVETPFSIASDIAFHSPHSESPIIDNLSRLIEDIAHIKTILKTNTDIDTSKKEARKSISDQSVEGIYDNEKWRKFIVEFPSRGGTKTVPLEISSQQSIADTVDEIWFILNDDASSTLVPEAYTYLWNWILIRKIDKMPLVIKRLMDKISAFAIFKENEIWQVQELDTPLLNAPGRFNILKGEPDRE